FLTLGLSIIPLYEDGDLNTTKFIQAEAECSSCPILTSSCIFPIGHIISPLNPIKGVVAGINWFLISGRSRLKQCLYSISKADPPSTYMRCMKWPSIYASMIIGPSVPSSSSREWKSIYLLREKLYVIFYLATLSQGWTIRMANALSFREVYPFFSTLGGSFPLFCLSSFIKCDSFPALSISSIYFLGACTHSCYALLHHGTHKIWYDSASQPESSLVAEL
nr:hypothetical protein [Tanacetum cinerariifolium]